MGQGIYTAVAMILAEELDAASIKCPSKPAPPNDKLYANPTVLPAVTAIRIRCARSGFPSQGGGRCARHPGSNAAQQWKVEPSSIRTVNGEAIHDASGRRIAYAALVNHAQASPPKDPPLKDVKDFKF